LNPFATPPRQTARQRSAAVPSRCTTPFHRSRC
jgi:hypothetical protein